MQVAISGVFTNPIGVRMFSSLFGSNLKTNKVLSSLVLTRIVFVGFMDIFVRGSL